MARGTLDGMRYAWLLVYVLGCGPAVDETPDAAPATLADEIDRPPGADMATSIVKAFYEARLMVTLPELGARWTDERIAVGDTTVIGLSYGCGDIRVTWTPTIAERFHLIALAHEIGHCARGIAIDDSDGSHSDPAWWGSSGLVSQANADLFEHGL
jgi:hypothetical protein